ncbi:DUF3413 domain-containing protein [Colwelliaceae bacterium BS250]
MLEPIKDKLSNWSTNYLLVNFIFALLISLRYLGPHQLGESIGENVFLISYFIGQIGFLSLLLTVLIKTVNLLIKKPVINKSIAIIFSSLFLALLLADTFVYQQYRFHFNAMVFELLIGGGTEIFSFSWQLWLKIASIIMLFFVVQVFISELLWRIHTKVNIKAKPLLWAWFLCLLFSHGYNVWADALFKKQITKQALYLPLSYPTTAKSLMAKFGIVDIEAQKQQALLKQKKVKAELQYPISAMQCTPADKPKNVIVLVFDSWRADSMNSKITPSIAKLSEQATLFGSHYSGSNNTRHGMFSLFYGLPGHYWRPILDSQTSPVLMNEFQQQQYQMGIFGSATLTSPEFDQTIFRGIKNLRNHSDGDKPYQRDLHATKDFINWHKQRNTESPYFAFMLLDAAHGFSVPKNYPKVFTPALDEADYLDLDDDYDAKPLFNLYKNALHFMDAQVAKVLEEIKDDMDNTVIIITGDHGKEFNESRKGYWGHNSNYSDYQTKVPLIIHWPNTDKALFDGETSHYDIVPTLLTEVLGCNNPASDYAIGQSLFNKSKNEYLLLGRDGYYAIKYDGKLNELDRLGNFSIYDTKYQDLPDAKLDMKKVLAAMEDLRRFYKQ